jgi:uncharacterized membrane protein
MIKVTPVPNLHIWKDSNSQTGLGLRSQWIHEKLVVVVVHRLTHTHMDITMHLQTGELKLIQCQRSRIRD